MNYKHYIPLADRKDLYKHALLHAQLASPELANDVLRMTKHIDFMHEANAELKDHLRGDVEYISELSGIILNIQKHPLDNLYNWVCDLVDFVITL
jgi:hypothetical protein